MTFVVAPTLTGYPCPGVAWLPDQWLAMMRGEPARITRPASVETDKAPGPPRSDLRITEPAPREGEPDA